jgi:hypothetical protein
MGSHTFFRSRGRVRGPDRPAAVTEATQPALNTRKISIDSSSTASTPSSTPSSTLRDEEAATANFEQRRLWRREKDVAEEDKIRERALQPLPAPPLLSLPQKKLDDLVDSTEEAVLQLSARLFGSDEKKVFLR